MCGIAGYIGKRDAVDKVFDMLKRLEYRGYDSAGVAVIDGGLHVCKDKGRVDDVKKRCALPSGKMAMGQTRWATHGEPSQENAHPHLDCSGGIAIVHNGIIENFEELRKDLRVQGHRFASQTDSEVIAHLVENSIKKGLLLEEAFIDALKKLEGSFAILLMSTDWPDRILFARNESPLIIGIGKGENFIASDIPAILPDTNDCIVLEDMQCGVMTAESVVIKDLRTGRCLKNEVQRIEMDVKSAEKEGYEHFMLKEIIEEPLAVRNALRSRAKAEKIAEKLKGCESVYFVACGTAYHAGLYGKYLLQEGGVRAFAEQASEFRYSTAATLADDAAVILISQSGETADTIAAAKEAKRRGAYIVAVVNVVGSTLTRIANDVLYTYSGPEIAVASTKAYLGQLASIALLCSDILKQKGRLGEAEYKQYLAELDSLPSKIDQILDSREIIKDTAASLANIGDFFYIGRGMNLPTAYEGALKLKEISYLHAEAYPAGELKHGPLALMEKKVCVVAINPSDRLRQKMASNIQEVRARGAKLLELSDGDMFSISNGTDIKITVPRTHSTFTPLLMIVPLHLLSYYIAAIKGFDIDKPRNLAKSVTVE